jgi:hypothetical protein
MKKKYSIHNNYDEPFIVYINGLNIIIYKNYYECDDKPSGRVFTDDDIILKQKCKEIFIGKSFLNKMTEYSKGYGKRFDGNTILVRISDNKYIYISNIIYSFITKNKIIKYFSPVGNNDIPYPYAIDDKGYYYLFLDNIIVKNMPLYYKNEPYEYYYDYIQHIPSSDVLSYTTIPKNIKNGYKRFKNNNKNKISFNKYKKYIKLICDIKELEYINNKIIHTYDIDDIYKIEDKCEKLDSYKDIKK